MNEPTNQLLINVLLGAVSALSGAMLAALWQSVKELHTSDKEINKKISDVEVLVAGDYIRKDAFDKLSNDLFTLLHRIEDKIDRKQDKL